MFQPNHNVPTTGRKIWGYFKSGPGGTPMLILDCRLGKAVRVPHATNVTLLGFHSRGVRVGIEFAPTAFAPESG
jgi:hypothetical protein